MRVSGWALAACRMAWKHVMVGQSIMAGTSLEASMVKDGIDKTSVEGVADSPLHRRAGQSPDRTALATNRHQRVVVALGGHNAHTAFVMEVADR